MSNTQSHIPKIPTVLDQKQFARIRALHGGFLYQHLYAVACLLQAHDAGIKAVSVERDEDIELATMDTRWYIQVKERSAVLTFSDIEEAMTRFKALRTAHRSGARQGRAQFVIVANVPMGPALSKKRTSATWPSDVALLCGPGSSPPHPGLPRPCSGIEDSLSQCTQLAAALPLSALRPDTLTWKLASIVAAASSGVTQGGNHTFSTDDVEAMCELVRVSLHPFPATEHYWPQVEEPELVTPARVRLILGHQGFGKSAWAGQAALHAPGRSIYFGVTDTPGQAVAARLVREVFAHLATGEAQEPVLLPGATGLEALAALDRAVARAPGPVTIVVDDAHRIEHDALVPLVTTTRHLRWTFLARPHGEIEKLTARLGIVPETLQGWDDDGIAANLHAAGCLVSPADAAGVRTLTGGAPLFVLGCARTVHATYAGRTTEYLGALRTRLHETRTAQEVLLEDAFARLTGTARRVAGLLSVSALPLPSDDWRAAAGAAGIDAAAFASTLRELGAACMLVRRQDGSLGIHDAFRVVARTDMAEGDREREIDALIERVRASVIVDRSPGRLMLFLDLLASRQRFTELADLVTKHAEWFRELGILMQVYLLLEAALGSGTLSPEDRFWTLDTLAFFDIERHAVERAFERLAAVDVLLAAGDTPDGLREVARHKRMQVLFCAGKVNEARELFERAPTTDTSHDRVLRYSYAVGCAQVGLAAEALRVVSGLADEYLGLIGLRPDDVFARNADDVASRIRPGVDVEDIRRLADCFDVIARIQRSRKEFPGLAGIWAVKFYGLAEAPASAVKSGQDVVDDLLGLGHDPEGALQFMETAVLPIVDHYQLAAYRIPTASQHAVLLAHCGRVDEARAELARLEPYLPAAPEMIRSEVANQKSLIDTIERMWLLAAESAEDG